MKDNQYLISDIQILRLNPIIDAIASCDPEVANKGELSFNRWLNEAKSKPFTKTVSGIDCEKCPFSKQCTQTGYLPSCSQRSYLKEQQAAKEARNNVLNELRDAIRNTKKYGTIEPEVMFHWTGIIAIIDELRIKEK